MNNRGSIAMMSAVLTIPLLLFAGLAVDVSRMWLLRQRMQWAVDTAALLGASQANGESADSVMTDAQELFWVSYGASNTTYHPPKPPPPPASPPLPVLQTGFLGSSSAGATVVVAPTAITAADGTITPPNVTVTASATLSTSIMSIMGTASSTVTTTGQAAVPHKVEMALVLDNSLSMALGISGGSKMDALKTAANNLLNTILGSGSSPNVSVAIVPFAGAVNVGTDSISQSFLKNGTLSAKFANDTTTAAGWRGCVQARAYPSPAVSYDITEDPPSTAAFDPYWSPSTYHKLSDGKGGFVTGDNDWTATSINDNSTSLQDTDVNTGDINAPLYFGPNLFCPYSPVVKLTNNRAALNTSLTNMTALNGGGTIMIQGLQWGWFTLSPLWTVWGLSNSAAGAARPAPYADTGTTKIVVMMTDGVNEVDGIDSWYGAAAVTHYLSDANGYYPDPTPNCEHKIIYPECTGSDSWYTSYQRVLSGILLPGPLVTTPPSGATSLALRNSANSKLKSRFNDLCTNMKNSKVIIYTIFFHGSSDDQVLRATQNGAGPALKTCATDSTHYFDSQSASDINAAFAKIAQAINDLRLRQ